MRIANDLRPVRPARQTLWVSFVLCAALAINAYAFDIFSIVYANPSGQNVLSGNGVTIDISNAKLGYAMVRHVGSANRLKTRISANGFSYVYDLDSLGEYDTYPLQFGSGQYKVEVLQNVKDSNYAMVYQNEFQAMLDNANAPFLCPSKYVWYTPSTAAVAKSYELCDGLTTDRERVDALFDFVSTTIMYDYIKALSPIEKTYVPDLDTTLDTHMGICFDYASLLACMLRVQGIPTKLIMGDLLSQGQYHAWNQVLVDGDWTLYDATFAYTGTDESNYAEDKFF